MIPATVQGRHCFPYWRHLPVEACLFCVLTGARTATRSVSCWVASTELFLPYSSHRFWWCAHTTQNVTFAFCLQWLPSPLASLDERFDVIELCYTQRPTQHYHLNAVGELFMFCTSWQTFWTVKSGRHFIHAVLTGVLASKHETKYLNWIVLSEWCPDVYSVIWCLGAAS